MDYTTIYYYSNSSTIFYIDDESDELNSIDKLKSNWAEINIILLECLKIMKTLI